MTSAMTTSITTTDTPMTSTTTGGAVHNGWQVRAACTTAPGSYRPTAAPGPGYLAEVAAAKAICSGCPVATECLTDALTRCALGIAGGLTATERAAGHARHRTTDTAALDTAAGTGTVYLLHFARPYRHARHYCGWTTDLPARLAAHSGGRGARLLAVITDAGIGYHLARTWPGPRARERQIKNQGGLSRCCPLCGVTPRPGTTTLLPLTAGGAR